MNPVSHDDDFVQQLFDNMGPTYSITNVISSFGFSEFWRYTCIKNASIKPHSMVCDMMAGSGECWRYLPRKIKKITAIDFSEFMVNRQKQRASRITQQVDILRENATATSIEDASVDHIISNFGLKTLSSQATSEFFIEIERILKPGGTFSLLEISIPKAKILRVVYDFYLSRIIPLLGKCLLGDIECYRMLGKYTKTFGSCLPLADTLEAAGLNVETRQHFFGCATSLVGSKP